MCITKTRVNTFMQCKENRCVSKGLMGKQRLSPSYNSIKTTALSSDDTELYQTNLWDIVNFSTCPLHLSWYIRLPKPTEPLINKQKSRWHKSRTSIYICYHSRASAGGYFRKLDSVFFLSCCLCVCIYAHCLIVKYVVIPLGIAKLHYYFFGGVIWSHCLYFLLPTSHWIWSERCA